MPDAVGPLDCRGGSAQPRPEHQREPRRAAGGPPARRAVKWLLRQLRKRPSDLRSRRAFANARETSSLLLGEAREYPQRLLSPTDPKREPRAFTPHSLAPMGTKRGKGDASFVLETRRQAVDFYRDLVQDLTAWQPSAPKLPKEPQEAPPTPQPSPPPFSATDERDPGEAISPTGDSDGSSGAAGFRPSSKVARWARILPCPRPCRMWRRHRPGARPDT